MGAVHGVTPAKLETGRLVEESTRPRSPIMAASVGPRPNPTSSWWLANAPSVASAAVPPASCDLAIIGAGMTGCAVAHWTCVLDAAGDPEDAAVSAKHGRRASGKFDIFMPASYQQQHVNSASSLFSAG